MKKAKVDHRTRSLVTKETRLTNGLRVIHLHTQHDPVSAAHLFIPGGAGLETAPEGGVSTLMWSLLLKGTERRTARQLAEDIESIGASMGGGATHDYSEVSCHSISDYFLPALEILSEALLRPAFPAPEVEKEREALIASIRSRQESIFAVASEQLNKRLYGDHAYGRQGSGTEKTVPTITRDELVRWHKRTVIPDNAVLTVASIIPFKELLPELNRLFGGNVWKGGKRKVLPLGLPKNPKAPEEVALDKPFEQAYLLIGYPAPPVDSKDYIPLKLLTSYLGGGMSALLFQELREKRGLAYDVGSFYASKKSGSAFVIYMGLQYSRLKEARQHIEQALKNLAAKPISARELTETKSYLKGTYILDHQTNGQRAHYLGWWATLGLGSSFDNAYLRTIDRITPDMVHKAAKRTLAKSPVIIEIHPTKSKNKPAVAPA